VAKQEGPQRCASHNLAYDANIHSGCVLCRAERDSSSFAKARVPLLVLVAVLALAGGALVLMRGRRVVGSETASAAPPPNSQRSELRVLKSRNTVGRGGVAFLPHQLSAGARPLLVLFHGTGGSGSAILGSFRSIAEQRGLIVVAPDSGRSPDGAWNWQVGDAPGELTADRQHTTACIEEVLALPGVRVDGDYVLAAGYSGGASSAPYLASNDARFRAFAVLHGGVFAGGLGSNRVRGWFSTGEGDTLRTPRSVRDAGSSAAERTGPITFRAFAGGHELSRAEVDDLIEWWLGS
jgi:poly(3-hydroxybutyrate) depolymerase